MKTINKAILSIFILGILFYFNLDLKYRVNKDRINSSLKTNRNVWDDTPRVSVMCRLYDGSALEYYNVFHVSYLLFWPFDKWINSDVVIVFDDENEEQHRFGTILANMPPYPKIHYEKDPGGNIFCSNWRRSGYARQQYSTFYMDLYTDSDYIAIVDSDSFFTSPVMPEDLFINGKPRIIGYNGCCVQQFIKGVNETIGEESPGEFMVANAFPIIFKREHLKSIREHVTMRMKAKTFEEAFHKICSKYVGSYSQFDIMFHYLWHYKHDEYSWHIKDAFEFKHHRMKKLVTNSERVKEKNDPIISLSKHCKLLFLFDIKLTYFNNS